MTTLPPVSPTQGRDSKHTILFAERLRAIADISQEETGDNGIKRGIREGKRKRVGSGPIHRGAPSTFLQHPQCEIGSYHLGGGMHTMGGTGQVASSRADIEQPRAREQIRPAHHFIAPAGILPEGHDAVQQVIVRRDASEQRADAAGMVGRMDYACAEL